MRYDCRLSPTNISTGTYSCQTRQTNHRECHIKGANSLHTLFLEWVRMIKYRVSISEWNIYYCHVVHMGCLRHIFTCNFHSVSQIFQLKVWHNETKLPFPWQFVSFCCLTASCQIFIDSWYIVVIYERNWLYVSNSHM